MWHKTIVRRDAREGPGHRSTVTPLRYSSHVTVDLGSVTTLAVPTFDGYNEAAAVRQLPSGCPSERPPTTLAPASDPVASFFSDRID